MAMNNKVVRWVVVGGVAAAAAAGILYWKAMQSKLPAGIASGNGRLEAKLVDIAAKEALKVKEVLVDEGAMVKPGEVLVKLDTITLDAELAAANAAVAAAKERLTVAEASIGKQRQEIALAETEAARSAKMLEQRASSQQEVDIRNTKVGTTKAQLAEVSASLETAKRQVDVAIANATTIQTRIDDATLKSPVMGRVLYRLAEPGEVLAAGGKVLTVVNLEDIYMEIFLPSEQAASVKLGTEGRITVDYLPEKSVAGLVTFVSPQAQFTPKQVETKSERDKLMFRVKIQLPKDISPEYLDRIKTGVRGVGYVKLEPDATWPTWLNNVLALK